MSRHRSSPLGVEGGHSEVGLQQELQVLFLKRQWELLEFFKSLRTKVPVVFCGAILVFSSYMMEATKLDNARDVSWAILPIIVVLVILGNVVLHWIARQYEYTSKKINYLYGQLGIAGPAFLEVATTSTKQKTGKEDAPFMFIAGHLAITLIGAIASLGFYL